jgi:4-amino-4-deoxy-L-arabinose transferase-like glycosyltransferase
VEGSENPLERLSCDPPATQTVNPNPMPAAQTFHTLTAVLDTVLAEPARRRLLGLLALATVIRAAWWVLYTDVIENEGVVYARLAANWFHGRGYVDIFGGTNTLFPPLYPILIGLFAPAAGSEEAAARFVALLAGLALVGGIFGLARRVFDERIALLAGFLAACHPLLVAISASTYSESLFLGLATLSGLATVRCIERPSVLRAAAVGGLVGLAYLTRPEGIALAAAFGGLVLLAGVVRRRGLGASLLQAGIVAAAAGLIAAPYVADLSRTAGAFRWEGKSWMNNAIAARWREGLSQYEAGRGLGPDAEPLGPQLFVAHQDARLALPPQDTAGGIFDTILADPAGRAVQLVGLVVQARPHGSPVVLALALVGLLATPWWRTRLFEGAVLLVLPGLAVAVLFAVTWTWDRYLFPLLPAALVWAAAGADWLGRLAGATAARLALPARLRILAAPLATGVLALGILVVAARNAPHVGELKETQNGDVRAAGAWIGADHAAWRGGTSLPRIAGIGVALAYYAGGEALYLPEADEARALRFLRDAAPDYLALRDSELNATAYARDWFAGRLAHPCAEPVSGLPADAATFRVWRWTCAAQAPAPTRQER